MNSGEILYSAGGNDECYTPAYGVEPILKYIPKGAVVWCPFDTKDSEFVKQISKTNKVIATHLRGGAGLFLLRAKGALGRYRFKSTFYRKAESL